MGLRALIRLVSVCGLLTALPLLVGCGGDDDAARSRRMNAPEPTPRQNVGLRGPALLDSFFDPEGNLLPSDQVVAGLTLPQGFELVVDEERRHVYKSDLTVIYAQRYLGPMLITGEVRRVGSGAIFVDAVPRDARGSAVRLDVSVYPRSGGGTRLEIVERLPAGAEPPPIAPELTEDE